MYVLGEEYCSIDFGLNYSVWFGLNYSGISEQI